jgi:ParB family chromosome partitioning protein
MLEKKNVLGRGLDALLGGDDNDEKVMILPVSQLVRGKYQPRKTFEPQAMAELIDSIRDKGVLQPLLVRELNSDRYEIIAGERRWQAAKKAGLTEVPALVKQFSDQEAFEIALIENIQRENLNPLEEAQAFKRLMDEFSYNQEEVAKVIGKSRSYVANALRLLALPQDIKAYISDHTLTAGHARALLKADNQLELAQEAVARKLTVREVEQKAARSKPAAVKLAPSAPVNHQLTALATRLTAKYGLRTDVVLKGKKGSFVIKFSGDNELTAVTDLLSSWLDTSR